MSKKRYIKLDPNERYLFGGADKVLFRDNIYILDKRQKKMVVFDQEGNGVNILHRVGQGPEEYIQITDFSVDTKGNIFMVDGVSDKLRANLIKPIISTLELTVFLLNGEKISKVTWTKLRENINALRTRL